VSFVARVTSFRLRLPQGYFCTPASDMQSLA
jgi:hypothetical protein